LSALPSYVKMHGAIDHFDPHTEVPTNVLSTAELLEKDEDDKDFIQDDFGDLQGPNPAPPGEDSDDWRCYRKGEPALGEHGSDFAR
jgi:hypothetical protein